MNPLPIDAREYSERYRDTLYPQYQEFEREIFPLFENLLKRSGIRIAILEVRVKTPESVRHKFERKRSQGVLELFKDFLGIVIVVYYQDDVKRVSTLLRREFWVDARDSEDHLTYLDNNAFGYRSEHLAVTLTEPRVSLPEWKPFAHLWVEVQIRTLLQHAWAKMSHELLYKRESQISAEDQRMFARLSALLELADKGFSALRDNAK